MENDNLLHSLPVPSKQRLAYCALSGLAYRRKILVTIRTKPSLPVEMPPTPRTLAKSAPTPSVTVHFAAWWKTLSIAYSSDAQYPSLPSIAICMSPTWLVRSNTFLDCRSQDKNTCETGVKPGVKRTGSQSQRVQASAKGPMLWYCREQTIIALSNSWNHLLRNWFLWLLATFIGSRINHILTKKLFINNFIHWSQTCKYLSHENWLWQAKAVSTSTAVRASTGTSAHPLNPTIAEGSLSCLKVSPAVSSRAKVSDFGTTPGQALAAKLAASEKMTLQHTQFHWSGI